MTIADVTEGRRGRARALLGGAVHRNAACSLDGLLERLFTLAFSGLVYPQIWEDPAVDMEAMEIEPHHHVVAIASGGCNVLSYLVADPAAITAVDLSHAHVALNKLKVAGLRHLPNWDNFYRFFGEAEDRANMMAYEKYLRPHLDDHTRRYWERRSLSGRRRLSHFRSNIFRKGLLGRFIGISHLVARAYGQDMEKLLSARNLRDQRAFFEEVVSPLFDRRLVKWVTSRRISLYGLGIPPAQYEALAGGQAMPDVLRARLEKLVCDFPIRDNYFAWQAFGRSYAPGGAGPLPPYLQERHFAALKKRAERVDVRHVSFTDAVNAMAPGTAHRFVLLDAQDWMTDTQLEELWAGITHAAAPGARVIFRTAGRDTILPGRVPAHLLGQWRYLEQRSQELCRRDRSSIYGGFHVYERAAAH
ncbi:DUF3419 family protein [Aestuariivirga sp.]|uniref:DUF3419 family protein n=1 Tax=Aestuariivirga sp. TaxID=2650926 RepID=UPI003BA9524F